MTKRAIFMAALLPLAACASTTPPPSATASNQGTAYQGMSCEDLAAAAKNAAADLAWARLQQQETFSGDTTSNVTFSMPISRSGSPGAGPHVGRLKSEQASLRDTMNAKGCS